MRERINGRGKSVIFLSNEQLERAASWFIWRSTPLHAPVVTGRCAVCAFPRAANAAGHSFRIGRPPWTYRDRSRVARAPAFWESSPERSSSKKRYRFYVHHVREFLSHLEEPDLVLCSLPLPLGKSATALCPDNNPRSQVIAGDQDWLASTARSIRSGCK
jgi:hypothetical protein